MKKAEEYYNSPHSDEIPILYKIRLKYEFGYDESIDRYYYDLAKMISEDKNGLYDKTHFVFWYVLGAKPLELSYLSGTEKEERLSFYKKLETKYGIQSLCKKIETIFLKPYA